MSGYQRSAPYDPLNFGAAFAASGGERGPKARIKRGTGYVAANLFHLPGASRQGAKVTLSS